MTQIRAPTPGAATILSHASNSQPQERWSQCLNHRPRLLQTNPILSRSHSLPVSFHFTTFLHTLSNNDRWDSTGATAMTRSRTAAPVLLTIQFFSDTTLLYDWTPLLGSDSRVVLYVFKQLLCSSKMIGWCQCNACFPFLISLRQVLLVTT